MINFKVTTNYGEQIYCHHVIGIEKYHANNDVAKLVYDNDYDFEDCAAYLSIGYTIEFEDGRIIEITKDNAKNVISLVETYIYEK